MASDYSSGSASSFADVLTALNTFLLANGWASAAATGGGRIFTKGTTVARVRSDDTPGAETLFLVGATGSSGGNLTAPAPNEVCMRSAAPVLIVFPVTYEFYVDDTPDEVYAIISYGGNKYQHLHFGKSDIPGIGGTGMWFSGSQRDDNNDNRVYMQLNFQYAQTGIGGQALGYFIDQTNAKPANFVHCALEGSAAWRAGAAGSYSPGTAAGYLIGQDHLAGLLQALPSWYNESEVLLPIYAALLRTDGTRTIVAVMRHARFLRIDNVTPGDLITYGSEQWKAYPLYAKNLVERNGVPWFTGADHSGSWGVAIRYPGA